MIANYRLTLKRCIQEQVYKYACLIVKDVDDWQRGTKTSSALLEHRLSKCKQLASILIEYVLIVINQSALKRISSILDQRYVTHIMLGHCTKEPQMRLVSLRYLVPIKIEIDGIHLKIFTRSVQPCRMWVQAITVQYIMCLKSVVGQITFSIKKSESVIIGTTVMVRRNECFMI